MKSPITYFFTLFFLTFNSAGWGQAENPDLSEQALAEEAISALGAEDLGGLSLIEPGEVRDSLLDPNTLNSLLGRVRKPKSLTDFIDAVNLRIIAFEPTGSDTESGLGISYDFQRAFTDWTWKDDPVDPIVGAFSFHAQGRVAFDQARNPNDFLDTGFSFHAYQLIQTQLPSITALSDAERRKVIDAQRIAAKYTDEEELNNSPEWQSIMKDLRPMLTPDFFWDVSGHASLESNQDFSQRQYAYGLKAAAVFRVWNPDNAISKWNVFDWPFALTRLASGANSKFTPSGLAIPSVLVGFDGVDPSDDGDRLAVDPSDSVYPRFRGEVAYKTKAARLPISGKDVWFSASYRYFKELDASHAIRGAGLDESNYLALTLGLSEGFYLSYSNGKLPLGFEDEQVLGVGFKVNF